MAEVRGDSEWGCDWGTGRGILRAVEQDSRYRLDDQSVLTSVQPITPTSLSHWYQVDPHLILSDRTVYGG